MGTSHAAEAPNTVRWEKVSGSLRTTERNAGTVLQATLSAAIPWVPVDPLVKPAVTLLTESIKFSLQVERKGLAQAARDKGIELTENYVAFAISEGLWKSASSVIPTELISTPYGKLAEIAFKKTLSSVIVKGVKAMGGDK